MEKLTLEQFDAIWEQNTTEEPLVEVEVRKLDVDLSLSTMLERFLSSAERYLEQGKIKKDDYDELVAVAGSMQKILTKMKEKDLIAEEIKEKAKKISRDIQDRVDKLKADLGKIF